MINLSERFINLKLEQLDGGRMVDKWLDDVWVNDGVGELKDQRATRFISSLVFFIARPWSRPSGRVAQEACGQVTGSSLPPRCPRGCPGNPAPGCRG